MAKIFSIDETDFFNPNFVKVIHGVAGRGKSSVVVAKLQKRGRNFTWTTSTNKLKRDASERYGIDAKTVCAGLFENRDGRFYLDFKDPQTEIVVIDEILQTSPRVIDWIREYVGKTNIIILTDKKQMLTKEKGKRNLLREFEELLQESYIITDEDKSTKRARTQETKAMIEYLYNCDGVMRDEFPKAIQSGRFQIVKYEDVSYNENDVFIFHKNAIEDKFYRDQQLSSRPVDDMCIPKGSIANNPPASSTRIPIMSQLQYERTRAKAYYQMKNVGSPTRYQGSECDDTKKLYYFIDMYSRVSNREWYTVVSRCWDISSIVIVVDYTSESYMKEFRGKKIKDFRTLNIMEGDIAK